MRVITATELRARLGEILDAASTGERILIERDRKPLVYLVSVEEVERTMTTERDEKIARQLAALSRLVEFGKEMREKYPPPDDGLTEAEWRHREHDRRADQIDRAASGLPPRRLDDGTDE